MVLQRPLRVLHLNFGTAGIGHYGSRFAIGLASLPETETCSLLSQDILLSPLCDDARRLGSVRSVMVRGRSFLRFLAEVLRHAITFAPDIVHDTAGSASIRGTVASAILSFRWTVIVTEHEPGPLFGGRTRLQSRIARWIVARRARMILVHGSRSRRAIIARGIPQDRVSVVTQGHYGFFNRGRFAGTAREPQTVLFFGALRPSKGVELLPEICRSLQVSAPSARLVVAGSPALSRELMAGPWPETLRSVLSDLHRLPNCEIHARYVPDVEVEWFFRRASIVLVPYLAASQSAVVMIAQAFGACVVATNVGDLPDVIVNGVTGVLCEPSPAPLAATVASLLGDPTRVEKMGDQARSRVLSEYAWERVVGAQVRNYRHALTSRPRRTRNRAEE